jgi:hypothetical protein
MKVPTKFIAYGVVGLAAAGYFFYDRATAPAAPAVAVAASPSRATARRAALPAAAADAANEPSETVIADRLRAAAQVAGMDAAPLRDAFATPANWTSAAAPVAAVVQPASVSAADEFRHAHRLSAVLISGKTGQAVVDGKIVKLGDSLDGSKLVAIGRLFARFTVGGDKVELPLMTASSGAVAATDQR